MEFKLLSVTGLQTTPAYFCNLMLTHCMGGEDARIVVKRTKDGVSWEQEGTWVESAIQETQDGKLVLRRLEPVWMDAYDAFWCSAIPVALSRDLVRVDFIFSEDAESFLRDIVLREMRLSWPEMQITDDETNAEQQEQVSAPLDVIEDAETREIVRLWNAGDTAVDIGSTVGLSPGRVRNKLTEARQKHGVAVVRFHRT